MSSLEVFRLLAEILALIALFGGGLFWLTKLLWRVYEQGELLRDGVRSTNTKLDALNGTVAHHAQRLEEHSKQLAFLEGREIARAEIAEAAIMAANLVRDAAATATQLIEKQKEVS